MSLWLRRAHAPRLLCALLLCASALAATGIGVARAAVDESDLLPVDQAFALSAAAPQRDRIELQWKIAPGYYLYRHRIDVQVESGGFAADPLQLPRGERHHDEFFGDVETYRDALRAVLPGSAGAGAARIVLKVKYQGCADAGVCYPPQLRTIAIALPPGDAAGATLPSLSMARPGALQLPGTVARGASDEPPLPDAQAFALEANGHGPAALLLRVTPAPG
jgi:thiol:disulfide interchange protein DsbD